MINSLSVLIMKKFQFTNVLTVRGYAFNPLSYTYSTLNTVLHTPSNTQEGIKMFYLKA